jgi:hypothetical protein
MHEKKSLQIADLRKAFLTGELSARELIDRVLARSAHWYDPALWITRTNHPDLRHRASDLDAAAAADPDFIKRSVLFGIPFAVKDNIDVAGMPTTAACPAFAYIATETAPVVKRLLGCRAGDPNNHLVQVLVVATAEDRGPRRSCPRCREATRVRPNAGRATGRADIFSRCRVYRRAAPRKRTRRPSGDD